MPVGQTYSPQFSTTSKTGPPETDVPNTPNIFGFNKPYSAKFGVGGS